MIEPKLAVLWAVEQHECQRRFFDSSLVSQGGPLTVTDANLALGRLLPSFFPKIFGPGENEPLSLDATMDHFRQLTQEINLFLSSNQSQALKIHEESSIVLSLFDNLLIRWFAVFIRRLAQTPPTTQTMAYPGWAWRRSLWDSFALQMRPCAGQSELWRRYSGFWSVSSSLSLCY